MVSLVVRYSSSRVPVGLVSRRYYAPRSLSAGWKWFGIPTSLGVACIALVKLQRTLRGSANGDKLEESSTWQRSLFRQLSTRALSRTWGALARQEIPTWLRKPLLGFYVWAFGCKMEEAEQPDLVAYSSLTELFTRKLKTKARLIAKECQLVSPVDGTVLHVGQVTNGTLEQVKGVTFSLTKFFGEDGEVDDQDLHHIILYLSPGDYHHFHSPADWNAQVRRHIYGELLPVAPWAARTMPALFAINERVLISGTWEHGLFSMVAVGAFNVGSISLEHDKELVTNTKGVYQMGRWSEKALGQDGLTFRKGDRVGNFNLGSTVVLVFRAPKNFSFLVNPGQTVKYGQSLGQISSNTPNYKWG
ncbi:hypothetical protein EMCRGX_G023815 [Ephydatia muelleri]